MINENGVDTDDCTEWHGDKSSNKYGRLYVGENYPGSWADGRMPLHRYVYSLGHGTDSITGKMVRHLCHTKACSNLDHLAVGSAQDNVNDMMRAGRQVNQVKTHCPKGHPYSGDNLHIKPNGKRHCRACHRERELKRLRNDPEYRARSNKRRAENQRKSRARKRVERLAEEAGQ